MPFYDFLAVSHFSTTQNAPTRTSYSQNAPATVNKYHTAAPHSQQLNKYIGVAEQSQNTRNCSSRNPTIPSHCRCRWKVSLGYFPESSVSRGCSPACTARAGGSGGSIRCTSLSCRRSTSTEPSFGLCRGQRTGSGHLYTLRPSSNRCALGNAQRQRRTFNNTVHIVDTCLLF